MKVSDHRCVYHSLVLDSALLFLSIIPWCVFLVAFVMSGRDAALVQSAIHFFLSLWLYLLLGVAIFSWGFLLLLKKCQLGWDYSVQSNMPGWMLVSNATAISLLWVFASWNSPLPTTDWTGDGPASAVVGGRLPFSDASGWFLGSTALIQGADVEWVARRPLHALLRAGELALVGQHYQMSLLVQTLIVGLAIGALCAIFAGVASWPAALVLLVAMIKYTGGFLGSYLSEAHGIAVSCVGLGLMLAGWRQARFSWRLAGYAFFGLAASIRPGPMLMLLAVPATELILSEKRRWLRTALAAASLVVAMVSSSVSFRIIAAETATANANAANTLLGLSMGTSWNQATDNFFAEDPSRNALPARKMTEVMYQAAWNNFRQAPTKAFEILGRNLVDGLLALLYEAPRRIFGSGWTALVIWPVAAFVGWRRIRTGESWLVAVLLLAVGLVLSIPIIWSDGGWRGLTIGLPAWFVLIGAALALPVSCGVPAAPERTWRIILLALGLLTVAFIAFGLVRHATAKSHEMREPIVVHAGLSPLVNVVCGAPKARALGILDVTQNDLLASIQRSGLSVYRIDDTLRSITPPFSVAVVPRGSLSESSAWVFFPGFNFTKGSVVRLERFTIMPDTYTARADEWSVIK